MEPPVGEVVLDRRLRRSTPRCRRSRTACGARRARTRPGANRSGGRRTARRSRAGSCRWRPPRRRRRTRSLYMSSFLPSGSEPWSSTSDPHLDALGELLLAGRGELGADLVRVPSEHQDVDRTRWRSGCRRRCAGRTRRPRRHGSTVAAVVHAYSRSRSRGRGEPRDELLGRGLRAVGRDRIGGRGPAVVLGDEEHLPEDQGHQHRQRRSGRRPQPLAATRSGWRTHLDSGSPRSRTIDRADAGGDHAERADQRHATSPRPRCEPAGGPSRSTK